jgi:phosphoserine phosphatase
MTEQGFKYGEYSVRTRDEVYEEAKRFLILLLTIEPTLRHSTELLASTLAEFVHWMHDETRTHQAPSAMIAEQMMEDAGQASTDAAPPKVKTND